MKRFTTRLGQVAFPAILGLNARNLIALAALLAATQLPAQMAQYQQTLPGKGSKVQISGTSTIHDWKMESPILAGTFEIDSKVKLEPAAATLEGAADGKVSANAAIRIPVRTLKSYNAKMDEVYKQHMEEAKHRNIEFKLKELAVKKGERAAGKPFEFDSKGDLLIHGVTKAIEMPVKIDKLEGGLLKISGATKVKMSDYGVQPPNPKIPGLGEIVTGDEVVIEFDWVVQPKK